MISNDTVVIENTEHISENNTETHIIDDPFKDVVLTPGSSSLLAKNVLPISKRGSIPEFQSYYSIDKLVQSGVDPKLAEVFFHKYRFTRIKKGCLDNPVRLINTLLGLEVTRTPSVNLPKKTRAPRSPRVNDEDDVVNLPPIVKRYPEWHTEPVTNPNIFTMHGISATGKGTRLSQLIIYLHHKFDPVILTVNVSSDKDKVKPRAIGIYVKELNFILFGKWVVSNKVGRMISFSSYDWLQSLATTNGSTFFDVVKKCINEFNVQNIAFEGYPCMVDYRHIHSTFNNSNSIACYFTYPHSRDEGFEILQERVVGRSGKRIKGTCWNGNSGIISLAKGHIDRIESNMFKADKALHYEYDAPVTKFGEMVLSTIQPELLIDFLTFSDTNNTLRSQDDVESSISKVSEFYINQQRNVNAGVNLDV